LPVGFTFTKQDHNGHPLQGAVFHVYEQDGGDWNTVPALVAYSDANGQVTIDEMGAFVGLLPGHTYRLVEAQAPSSFVNPNEYWIIDVCEDGDITITSTRPGSAPVVIGDDAFTIANQRASLAFIKISEYSGHGLPGATFTLLANEDLLPAAPGYALQTGNSDINGVVYFANLRAGGTYYLTETVAPDGYILSVGHWVITVDSDGTLTVVAEEEAPAVNFDADGDILFTNRRIVDGNTDDECECDCEYCCECDENCPCEIPNDCCECDTTGGGNGDNNGPGNGGSTPPVVIPPAPVPPAPPASPAPGSPLPYPTPPYTPWQPRDPIYVPFTPPAAAQAYDPVYAAIYEADEAPLTLAPIAPMPLNPLHHAFMIGFAEDGTIRPQANITRAEVTTIFFRLISDQHRANIWSQTNSFNDVAPERWFNNPVSTMENGGLFAGIPLGSAASPYSFSPNQAATRAEFAAMVVNYLGLGHYRVTDGHAFTDIEGHWAADAINVAFMQGWVSGFGDGSFRPDQPITRAEVAALVNRALGRLPETPDDLLPGMLTWPDNADQTAWFYLYIQEATNSNLHEMKADGVHKTWTEIIVPRNWRSLEQPYSSPWDIVR
jgi:hypothetical protein